MKTTGINIILGVVVLSAAFTAANAVIGQEAGVARNTGVGDDIQTAEAEHEGDVDGSVTSDGRLNPLGALGKLMDSIALLPKLPSVIQNATGLDPVLANMLGAPGTLIALFTVVAIVLRYRL